MSGGMDCRSPPRLKLLLVFLLVSINIICLHGNLITGEDHLHCVTDYLFTINCSLNITTSESNSDSNSSYWLTFINREKFVCMLTNTNEEYFCAVKIPDPIHDDNYYWDTFVDTDSFEICLCHSQNDGPEICKQLDKKYKPVDNIKPNAPRSLTVSHNSSQRHFTWISTYEKYRDYTSLVDNLRFQLRYYIRGEKLNVSINTDSLNYSVDDEKFLPDTKYAARVRSSPNVNGQWSDWSSEVYWDTESAVNVHTDVPSNILFSGLSKVLIPLCVMVPIILLFCYAPVNKWRKSTFIPSPVPYFHTLYSDCQGDFKRWVVTQENMADMLKAEETLQIDTITKCEVIEEEVSPLQFHSQSMEGSIYSNTTHPGCDTSLLGIPYAVSTMAPPSPPGSPHQSLTVSSQPGSLAEGDSGCWLEKDPPWYCNEYCTISTFQQCRPLAAEHHGTKAHLTGIITIKAITEAQADQFV